MKRGRLRRHVHVRNRRSPLPSATSLLREGKGRQGKAREGGDSGDGGPEQAGGFKYTTAAATSTIEKS